MYDDAPAGACPFVRTIHLEAGDRPLSGRLVFLAGQAAEENGVVGDSIVDRYDGWPAVFDITKSTEGLSPDQLQAVGSGDRFEGAAWSRRSIGKIREGLAPRRVFTMVAMSRSM